MKEIVYYIKQIQNTKDRNPNVYFQAEHLETYKFD